MTFLNPGILQMFLKEHNVKTDKTLRFEMSQKSDHSVDITVEE